MSRAVGLVLGHALDLLLGDPRRGHPVAAFGRAAAALERRTHADSRVIGLLHAAVLTGGVTVLGRALERTTRTRPAAHTLVTAAATWAVLGGTTLRREADAVHAHLVHDDLPAARQRLTHLVGRDTSRLDADAISRAVVESVAENTSDAVVAPLLWGAVAGVPGLVGYRAANTLDAMVGHRSERHARFGWASARLDDLLNLPGARVAALLAAGLAPTLGGSPTGALTAWRRDARAHPSPNAGVVEAAFAGALGIRVGGPVTYPYGVEDRAVLGHGRPASPADVPPAVDLSRRVGTGAVLLAVLLAGLLAGLTSGLLTRRAQPPSRTPPRRW